MPGQPQFNADQNPFASIMSQMGPMGGSQGAPQQMPQSQPPQQQIPGSTQQQTAEQYQNPMEEQLLPGKTGDNAKALLTAIQGLQSYIQTSSDPRIIGMVRRIIQMVVQLLAQEQEQFSQGLNSNQEQVV